MVLSMKRIINIINDDNAIKIHYYNIEKEKYNYLTFFNALHKDFRHEYENLLEDNKKKYVSNSAEIYIPLVSAYVLAEKIKANKDYSYQYTLDKVRKLTNLDKGQEEVAVALYMILHEFGHWYNFKECGDKPYVYMGNPSDIDKERKLFEYRKKLERELSGKESLSESDEQHIKEYVVKYNNLKREKNANDYADKHFQEKYELLKKSGYM